MIGASSIMAWSLSAPCFDGFWLTDPSQWKTQNNKPVDS